MGFVAFFEASSGVTGGTEMSGITAGGFTIGAGEGDGSGLNFVGSVCSRLSTAGVALSIALFRLPWKMIDRMAAAIKNTNSTATAQEVKMSRVRVPAKKSPSVAGEEPFLTAAIFPDFPGGKLNSFTPEVAALFFNSSPKSISHGELGRSPPAA